MAKKKKPQQTPKPRNWLAIRAFQRGGSGRHTDKKKAMSKSACRGKVWK